MGHSAPPGQSSDRSFGQGRVLRGQPAGQAWRGVAVIAGGGEQKSGPSVAAHALGSQCDFEDAVALSQRASAIRASPVEFPGYHSYARRSRDRFWRCERRGLWHVARLIDQGGRTDVAPKSFNDETARLGIWRCASPPRPGKPDGGLATSRLSASRRF